MSKTPVTAQVDQVAGFPTESKQLTGVSIAEAIELGAEDNEFYSRTFFPRTVPKALPEFHHDVWDRLESGNRYVSMEIFRDGAKTSLLRLFASKRIAYGISRTIMIVGKGQDHAIRTLRWLKGQVENNKRWAQTFQLERGSKWSDDWIEIKNGLLKDEYNQPISINIVAYGMTGQIRGVNIDDYRPDLIIVDDPCDEENTGTAEQRKKMSDLFFGALLNCLVPRQDNPTAMMALLQTGLHYEDLVHICEKDSSWEHIKYSVFTDAGDSRWPTRWTTEELHKEKNSYIARNQLSLWLREKECRLVSDESSMFRGEWLKYYDTPPENLTVVLAIDPVPPPSDREVQKDLDNTDYEVLFVMGRKGRDKFVLDYAMNRGHDPGWTSAKFFELCDRWKPVKVVVHAVNYERTLKWILEQEMKKRKQYYAIKLEEGKARKLHRISNVFGSVSIEKNLYVRTEHSEFISQFSTYPRCAHDDVIDAGAVACKELDEMGDIYSEQLLKEEEKEMLAQMDRSATTFNYRIAP